MLARISSRSPCRRTAPGRGGKPVAPVQAITRRRRTAVVRTALIAGPYGMPGAQR